MSAISDYVASANAAFDGIDAALDTAQQKLGGVTDDVTFLKETIEKLQNNPGPISPEDQALLDAAQQRVNGLVTKTAGVAQSLQSLDDATERPTAPPA